MDLHRAAEATDDLRGWFKTWRELRHHVVQQERRDAEAEDRYQVAVWVRLQEWEREAAAAGGQVRGGVGPGDGGDHLGDYPVANEVVAHYLDGRMVKGVSLDIDPARPTCHIRTPDRQSIEVKLADLKALFFVKSLAGDPTYTEGSTVEAGDQRARGAYRIEVQFADGERVVGMTVRYPPVRPFFYVVPADGRSNNLRILINRAAVVRFEQPPSGTSP